MRKNGPYSMSIVILLGGCDYSHKEDQHGFFYTYLLSQWICYFTLRSYIP